jgi:hypothetical protein
MLCFARRKSTPDLSDFWADEFIFINSSAVAAFDRVLFGSGMSTQSRGGVGEGVAWKVAPAYR